MKRFITPFLSAMALLLLTFTPGSSADDSQAAAKKFSSAVAIETRLAQVRDESAQLAPGEVYAEQRALLQELEVALVQHREALNYRVQMRSDFTAVENSLSGWKGLSRKPPYSIQFADGLRAEHDVLERELRASASRLGLISAALEDANTRLTARENALRRANEAARLAESRQAVLVAEHTGQLETLRARIAAENAARLQLRHQAEEVRHTTLETALELAGLKLAAVKGKIEFTRSERDRIEQQLGTRRNQLLEIAGSAAAEHDDRQITWKIEILNIERMFWNAAYDAFNPAEGKTANAALSELRRLQGRTDEWAEAVGLLARKEMAEKSSVADAVISEADARNVFELQSRIRYTRELLGDTGVDLPGLLDQLVNGLLAVWRMELYLAEETTSIGGEKVTTYSPVTLGKILRLGLILAVGWLTLRFLALRLHNLVLRREVADPGKADMIRSWTFGIGLTILVLYGLNRVHIPFTAFAFLGGTLAIGIGFGAQTILKNFISGVILSLERPFKVGDLVEVDTVMGNIIHIGMRASVIRHFDGTDTLVPNSILLENRVSNWTFTDNAMRDSIEVGVAYGSSAHDVKQTLLSVAKSHGLVLDKPAPSVQFKKFGDNALDFSLLYWFDALRIRPPVIASDLHFMVDHAFREAGIRIAFPQRDVHFDANPLKIELTRPQAEGQ
jgi:small-conductance mechanosensitive channel